MKLYEHNIFNLIKQNLTLIKHRLVNFHINHFLNTFGSFFCTVLLCTFQTRLVTVPKLYLKQEIIELHRIRKVRASVG